MKLSCSVMALAATLLLTALVDFSEAELHPNRILGGDEYARPYSQARPSRKLQQLFGSNTGGGMFGGLFNFGNMFNRNQQQAPSPFNFFGQQQQQPQQQQPFNPFNSFQQQQQPQQPQQQTNPFNFFGQQQQQTNPFNFFGQQPQQQQQQQPQQQFNPFNLFGQQQPQQPFNPFQQQQTNPFQPPRNPSTPTPTPAQPSNGNLPDMMPIVETTVASIKAQLPFEQMCIENNPSNKFYCDAQESGITEYKCHEVLRFSVGIGNVGNADLVIGDAREPRNQGMFEYGNCHKHYHWKHFASYAIVDKETGQSWRSAKRGFCAVDLWPVPSKYAVKGTRVKNAKYTQCGDQNRYGGQGISVGYQDVYARTIPGQFFCIDGCGDGQPAMPRGRNYTIRIIANPPYDPQPGEPCPAKDNDGKCRRFAELDYTNNQEEVDIYIPTAEEVQKLRGDSSITTAAPTPSGPVGISSAANQVTAPRTTLNQDTLEGLTSTAQDTPVTQNDILGALVSPQGVPNVGNSMGGLTTRLG